MATRIQAFVIFFSFLFISPSISSYNNPNVAIKSWCIQTLNPQPCEYFLTNNPKYFNVPINGESDFIKLSTQLALDQSLHVQNNIINSPGTKFRDELEKAAWDDCVVLYDETIRRINKTIDPQCSPSDAQTWLSAALTNLETCNLGFHEFGIKDHVFIIMSNNISLLLSNTLELNKKASNFGDTRGFPKWVAPGDRRFLRRHSSHRRKVVVAQDGSGDFTTLSEAIAAAKPSKRRYVIHVKEGTYNENVDIGSGLKKIVLLGDGIGRTIITGSRSVDDGYTTYKTATVAVTGDGFIAKGITFRNTAGREKQQAVALRSESDESIFYKCSFEGYQDTLNVHSNKQFYRDCDIYGTVDFIFGNAAVVFQNCNIYLLNPLHRTNTITAQGRDSPHQDTGISIQNSRVTSDPELRPDQGSVRSYLGRPWRKYSRVVYIETFLDDLIDPSGWLPWNGDFALDTLSYGEYRNTGPGASTENRVKWGGYHVITDPSEAEKYTPQNFIDGNSWISEAKIPATYGL